MGNIIVTNIRNIYLLLKREGVLGHILYLVSSVMYFYIISRIPIWILSMFLVYIYLLSFYAYAYGVAIYWKRNLKNDNFFLRFMFPIIWQWTVILLMLITVDFD